MKFKEFIRVCNDREVIKSVTIFIISCWTVIQVSSITHDAIGLPEEFVSVLIILFFLSFPLYLLFLWETKFKKAYENEDVTEEIETERKSFRVMYFRSFGGVVFISLVMITLVFSNKFRTNNNMNKLLKQSNSDKIAVLQFENKTTNENYDIIGQMASDWISHGITENEIAQIISPKTIESYREVLATKKGNLSETELLKSYLKPGKLITGSFYENDQEFIFQTSIMNGETNEIIKSFQSQECLSDQPLDCINKIKQVVLSNLANEEKKDNLLEAKTPDFEAYQTLLKAKNLNNTTSPEYLELINHAISIDSNYFEPKVARVGYYYNIGEFTTTDSLIQQISIAEVENQRQLNILSLYKSLLKGENDKVFTKMSNEYELAPFDLENNTAMMIIALQFVHLPELVSQIADEIQDFQINKKECITCIDRLEMKMIAYNELDEPEKTMELYSLHPELQKKAKILTPYLFALLRANHFSKADEVYSKSRSYLPTEDFVKLSFSLINNYQLVDKKTAAEKIIQLLKNDFSASLTPLQFNRLNIAEENYEEIINRYTNGEENKNWEETALLAVAEHHMGEQTKAANRIADLKLLSVPYDFGGKEYALALFYALTNQESKALSYLRESVANGNFFTGENFHNDNDFHSIRNTDDFEEILNYWNSKL